MRPHIWDELLNFIGVFSRMQIKGLIMNHGLTMIFAEHNQAFRERMTTKGVDLNNMAWS